MATDKAGRAYAKLSKLRPGHKVQVDGDFTCLPPNAICNVEESADGLFIRCEAGHHYLDGQLMDDGDSLVGIHPMGVQR